MITTEEPPLSGVVSENKHFDLLLNQISWLTPLNIGLRSYMNPDEGVGFSLVKDRLFLLVKSVSQRSRGVLVSAPSILRVK